jgi:hypothetical protein
MQVVACIVAHRDARFKVDLAGISPTDEPHAPHSRAGRADAMMAPVIIVGAMLVFVLWDTTESR